MLELKFLVSNFKHITKSVILSIIINNFICKRPNIAYKDNKYLEANYLQIKFYKPKEVSYLKEISNL